MNIGKLKSLGHNVADSIACGMGFLIGTYSMNVFAEAYSSDEGFITIDFLAGTTSGSPASDSFKCAVKLYRDALPDLCLRHGVVFSEIKALEVRYGTDIVYGQHFVVSVESIDGKRSTDQYVGVESRKFHQ
jgi:hypothetical protein